MTDPGFSVHRDEVLEEAIQEITRVARGHVANKKGHMTWAECTVLLRKMKTRNEMKESPTDVTTEEAADDPAAEDSLTQADGELRAHPD